MENDSKNDSKFGKLNFTLFIAGFAIYFIAIIVQFFFKVGSNVIGQSLILILYFLDLIIISYGFNPNIKNSNATKILLSIVNNIFNIVIRNFLNTLFILGLVFFILAYNQLNNDITKDIASSVGFFTVAMFVSYTYLLNVLYSKEDKNNTNREIKNQFLNSIITSILFFLIFYISITIKTSNITSSNATVDFNDAFKGLVDLILNIFVPNLFITAIVDFAIKYFVKQSEKSKVALF